MDVTRLVKGLWKWAWLIVLATSLAAGLSYRQTSLEPKIYRATTTVFVGQYLKLNNPNTGDIQMSQELAQSYAQLVPHEPIMQETLKALGLDTPWETLAKNVYASAVAGTSFVQISVVDTNPARAAAIANEIGRQLVLQAPANQDPEANQNRLFATQQLDDLKKKITNAQKQVEDLQTQMATETSALRIGDLRNQIGVLQEQISAWQDTSSRMLDVIQGSRTNYLSVFEPASTPTSPIGPNLRMNVLLAAAAGLLLSAGAALLLEYLDDTVHDAKEASRVLGLPIIGTIVRTGQKRGRKHAPVTFQDPSAPVSEAFRILRTNVQFASVDDTRQMILVTSPGANEGKSFVAANLATSFAQTGQRTILVEADLRAPSVHTWFGATEKVGLASLFLTQPSGASTGDRSTGDRWDSILRGDRPEDQADDVARVQESLTETALPTLKLLAAGPVLPANPAELLASRKMEQILGALGQMADVVVLDSPPVLAVADASILAAKATGVILVLDAGRTRTPQARQAGEALRQSKARMLGLVLNRAPASSAYHYYRYTKRSNTPTERKSSLPFFNRRPVASQSR